MSDPQTPDAPQPAEEERPPAVLGTLGDGPRDTSLGSAAPRSRRRTPPVLSAGEPPALPRGALVSLVRSGGLAFRTREVTVFRDGRVTYDADGAGGRRARALWLLGDEELAALQAELAAVDWRAPQPAARPSPDAYAYELTARVGRRLRRLEAAEGAIPESAEPPLRRLASYAPPEEP